MLSFLIDALFGCSHRRTTFPITPIRRFGSRKKATYIVCLDCGKEFGYNWQQMKVGDAVDPVTTAEILEVR